MVLGGCHMLICMPLCRAKVGQSRWLVWVGWWIKCLQQPLRKPDLSRTVMLHAASCSLFCSFIDLLLLSFAMSLVDQAAKTCLEKSMFRPSPQPAQAFAQVTLPVCLLFDLPVTCCQDAPGQALGHALHLQEPRGFHLSHTFRGEMSSLLCFCFLDDRLPRRTLRSTLRPLAVPALRTWCSTGSRPWQQHSVRGSSPSRTSASQSWAQAHPSCCWMTMMWSHMCRWVLPCGWALAGAVCCRVEGVGCSRAWVLPCNWAGRVHQLCGCAGGGGCCKGRVGIRWASVLVKVTAWRWLTDTNMIAGAGRCSY